MINYKLCNLNLQNSKKKKKTIPLYIESLNNIIYFIYLLYIFIYVGDMFKKYNGNLVQLHKVLYEIKKKICSHFNFCSFLL